MDHNFELYSTEIEYLKTKAAYMTSIGFETLSSDFSTAATRMEELLNLIRKEEETTNEN